MEQRICIVCDEPFTRSAGAGGTCSTRCMMWAKKHPGDKPDKTRTCPSCRLVFDVAHRAMRYCSPQCRAAASKRRTGRTSAPYVRYTTCATCAGPMPATARAGQKFCSEACGLRDKKAERAAMAKIPTRTCAFCDEPFRPRNRRHVTCSPRCSGMWHYSQNKALYSARAMALSQSRAVPRVRPASSS